MSVWKPVNKETCYGIAIYNFNDPEESAKLKLTVGDAVCILEEESNWYYGYVINNENFKGIFPKSYVHLKHCERIETTGPILKEPPITREITSTLREWGLHWKNLYVNHSEHFEQIKNKIYELINHRSKIISGTLPVDELKKITRQSAEEIDTGNKILGLDLVIRDKNGNLINPEETSTIQLFYLHKDATERMNNRAKSEIKEVQRKTAIQQFSNVFLVVVRNFTYKVSEDSELLMTLYDGKEFKAITENYVVRWTKEGFMSDLDQMNNLRVMFTDLGKKDLEREKIFLVCYVVRVGQMECKEVDVRNSVSALKKNNNGENMRRPCGVAAFDITNYMNGTLDTNLETDYKVPFISCDRDKDNLEQTLKQIITKEKVENKNQALFVNMKLLRGDLKQVREENPHLVVGNVSIARKMGFPEVILPGDVRNDLYLTLVNGEFTKGTKRTEKNVEVTVTVCNEKGQSIPGVIRLGGGTQPLNEYRSVIYYHCDRPQWYETFKVAVPIEEFKTSHLKFIFKHRSSSEAKDKSEKPFAMSYVKLMQENGTTLPDSKHSLVVYKMDYKKFDEHSLDYFKLPSTLNEMKEHIKEKHQVSGLSVLSRDYFHISSNICSTKLTQNVDLLGLLNWASHKETLNDSLEALMNVDGEEVVKFLQDILDALFDILTKTDSHDILIFECLLHIISLVSNDWKYQHFEPVLDLYIQESFSATLAYRKLLSVLKGVVSRLDEIESSRKEHLVFKTMKSLQYVMRFVSRSRILYTKLYQEDDHNFEESLRDLLQSIIRMMSSKEKDLLREQGACLKYLPTTIPDILLVFDHKELSHLLHELLDKIPTGRLTKQKMMTINEIVHSEIFKRPECRDILLPVITRQIQNLFEKREEVELCIKVMSDIMELLFSKNIGSVYKDLEKVIHTDLRTIIQTHIKMEKDNPHAGNLVAVMIDIFRQMNEDHYDKYINHFQNNYDVLDFLMEILIVFRGLVSNSVFPKDWCDMIMLQNSIILKSLRYFSHTIYNCFFQKFEHDAWNNFFHCAIAFMTQEPLQLENFSFNKKTRFLNLYKDMRREMGFEIKSMWFSLGQSKVQFVPSLVGLILEMTLIPEVKLREATIPIFYDMMNCEYYSSKFEVESYGNTKQNSSHMKGNFLDFENEMIVKLDALFEGGKGDVEYKSLFYDIMMKLCSQHIVMSENGKTFVTVVCRLMESLLEYRSIISDESKENTMSCTVNLLDFYSEINKQEMYIRYLNKLFELHLECKNYTEAAYTLELHAKLLHWSDKPLTSLLKGNKNANLKTHRQLKEALFYNIITNYSKGKMWEYAIEKCQELAEEYRERTFDYDKLSSLHKQMATFYDDIMKIGRAEPEYFRVGYYGKGFPKFLQNKVFIYRGKELERLADFNTRILNEFPKAELLNKLTPPGEDLTESDRQYIQINKVDPLMDEKKQRFSGKPISDQIVKFYRVNNIKKFTFSRPFTRKDSKLETDNEFAHLWLERTELTTKYPLPGILRWFPVEYSSVKEISPLRNAIETMEKTNKTLANYITVFNKDKSMQINPLSLTLKGILDANVMGGLENYEKVFFTADYETHYPDDKILLARLKDLLAEQIPLLDMCLQIHKVRAPSTLLPLQNRLEECFATLRADVEVKYGKRECAIKLDNDVQMRRHDSISNDRFSNITITPDNVGGRSRVSSLTRGQVSSFKNFTSNFNFTASSPMVNSRFVHVGGSKSLMPSPLKSRSGTPSLSSKKAHKSLKEKRRSSKPEQSTVSNNSTQWYTSDNESANNSSSNNNSTSNLITPVFELTQELHPQRPLRSEVEREKRLSRPSSEQFSIHSNFSGVHKCAGSSGASSNRDSIGTTDSSVSEEDMLPPPLPDRHRDLDYSHLIANNSENYSFLHSSTYMRNSVELRMSANVVTSQPVSEEQVDKNPPPTPPPKPQKNKKQPVL